MSKIECFAQVACPGEYSIPGLPRQTLESESCASALTAMSPPNVQRDAAHSKANCPVSKLFSSAEITMDAKLA